MSHDVNRKHWERLCRFTISFFLVGSVVSWIGVVFALGPELFMIPILIYALFHMWRINCLFVCPFCNENLSKHSWFFYNSLWANKNCQHCGKEFPQ